MDQSFVFCFGYLYIIRLPTISGSFGDSVDIAIEIVIYSVSLEGRGGLPISCIHLANMFLVAPNLMPGRSPGIYIIISNSAVNSGLRNI